MVKRANAYRAVFAAAGQENSALNEKQLASLNERFDLEAWHGDRLAFLVHGSEVIGFIKYEIPRKGGVTIDGMESFEPARKAFRERCPDWSIARELIAQATVRHGADWIGFFYLRDEGLKFVDHLNEEKLIEGGVIRAARPTKKLKPRLGIPIHIRVKSRAKRILGWMPRALTKRKRRI